MKVNASNLLARIPRVALFTLAALPVAVACNRDAPRAAGSSDSAVATVSSSPAVVKTNYVGLQYDSLPGSFSYRGGSVLPRRPARRNAEYDFAHVTTPMGEMIWLDTIGAPVGRGLRAKIVRAELKIPTLARDERLFMASCDVTGKLDPEVIAIAMTDSGATRFTKIRQAWRVNIPAARFELIPVAGIVCEEP
jgi:hypothetical protein